MESIVSQNIIYGIRLTYDLSHEYRYVGLSQRGSDRFKEHIKTARTKKPEDTHNPYLYRWIRKHFFQVTFDVLEVCNSPEELALAERKWIHIFRNRGYRLANGTDGGEGTLGLFWSEERKQEFSVSRQGINNPMFGKAQTEENKRIMSLVHTGKVVSVDTRTKISKAKQGKARSVNAKIKISYGRHVTFHIDRGIIPRQPCGWCEGTLIIPDDCTST